PGVDTAWPRSSRTCEPLEPATMMDSFAPATLYRLAAEAGVRVEMTTSDTAWPRSSRTFEPLEPATMMASFAPATLYRLATKARIRMMMTTIATAKKGVDVTKLGIGPCSFIGD